MLVTILICVSGRALAASVNVAANATKDYKVAIYIGSGMPVFAGASDEALCL